MFSSSPSFYYHHRNDGSNWLIKGHLCQYFLKLKSFRSQEYVLGCQSEKLKRINKQKLLLFTWCQHKSKCRLKNAWRYLAKKLSSCSSSMCMYIHLSLYEYVCTHWNNLKVKSHGARYIPEHIHWNSVWKSLINIKNFMMDTVGLSPHSPILLDIHLTPSWAG